MARPTDSESLLSDAGSFVAATASDPWLDTGVSVKITKVACQSCGANLEIEESVRFLTCRYCGSRLEVCHQPSAVYTKLLERVERTQRSTERELRLIRLERKLQRLDARWKSFEKSVSTRSKDGTLAPPGPGDAIMIRVLTVFIVLMLAVWALTDLPNLTPIILGMVAGFTGWMIASHASRRYREFESLRMRYARQRAAVRVEIDQLEREMD